MSCPSDCRCRASLSLSSLITASLSTIWSFNCSIATARAWIPRRAFSICASSKSRSRSSDWRSSCLSSTSTCCCNICRSIFWSSRSSRALRSASVSCADTAPLVATRSVKTKAGIKILCITIYDEYSIPGLRAFFRHQKNGLKGRFFDVCTNFPVPPLMTLPPFCPFLQPQLNPCQLL